MNIEGVGLGRQTPQESLLEWLSLVMKETLVKEGACLKTCEMLTKAAMVVLLCPAAQVL